MPNRKKAPKIKEIDKLVLPIPQKILLDNGIPVYVLNMGTQEILKLEVVYFAGRPYEAKKLAARATARLLKEGSSKYNSGAIAETIDYYGGTLSTPVNLDTSNIILYSLKKHFEKLLPIFSEILYEPVFPEEELQNFTRNNQQRLQVDLSKNDVVAYRQVTELIFGAQHFYGYNSMPQTYADLTREDLQKHYHNNYGSENCILILSGMIDDDTIKILNKHLGQLVKKGKQKPKSMPVIPDSPQKIKIVKKGSVQTAIRIGRKLFTRSHPDHKGMYILNTILGGYFSSRLMANIREDKGFTYNIFSNLDTMLFSGYFLVGTEVGNEYVDTTIKEIYKEFELLRQERIGPEELNMVQNYLLGNLLTILDGPFNVSEIIRTFVIEGIPFEEFEKLTHWIKNISPQEIQNLAQKYLDKEKMWEVCVGA